MFEPEIRSKQFLYKVETYCSHQPSGSLVVLLEWFWFWSPFTPKNATAEGHPLLESNRWKQHAISFPTRRNETDKSLISPTAGVWFHSLDIKPWYYQEAIYIPTYAGNAADETGDSCT